MISCEYVNGFAPALADIDEVEHSLLRQSSASCSPSRIDLPCGKRPPTVSMTTASVTWTLHLSLVGLSPRRRTQRTRALCPRMKRRSWKPERVLLSFVLLVDVVAGRVLVPSVSRETCVCVCVCVTGGDRGDQSVALLLLLLETSELVLDGERRLLRLRRLQVDVDLLLRLLRLRRRRLLWGGKGQSFLVSVVFDFLSCDWLLRPDELHLCSIISPECLVSEPRSSDRSLLSLPTETDHFSFVDSSFLRGGTVAGPLPVSESGLDNWNRTSPSEIPGKPPAAPHVLVACGAASWCRSCRSCRSLQCRCDSEPEPASSALR
ncbi:hypothetical protein F2P81_017955 [Scophthalmus maximus]|uniref:Uncharacterized protein n=1 Tax=Scophthalmus maximus TaxID=52904 RepID=A0A6A4SB01_SCOMX|nr:hypothetical protein F2P81_017955 [Scophthalmus maximus]